VTLRDRIQRMTGPIRRWLYAGGTRRDRLRDPDAVIAVLELRPGMIVGDLGPGAGHFTLRFARAVGADGMVYALDASRSTLEDLRRAADERGITNLRTVPIARDRLEVPQPVDLLFVSATYHHLPAPSSYFAGARTHLRPGGRVAILESRREGLLARWQGLHASPPHRVVREMADAGYRLTATQDVVYGHWFGLFEIEPGLAAPVQARGQPQADDASDCQSAVTRLFAASFAPK
jgi:predicted methyltransferase